MGGRCACDITRKNVRCSVAPFQTCDCEHDVCMCVSASECVYVCVCERRVNQYVRVEPHQKFQSQIGKEQQRHPESSPD